MNRPLKNQLISVFFLLFGTTIYAAQGSNEDAIVLEDMSIAQLRAEVERFENEFYRVFNSTLSDKSLEIHCESYLPTGSHISERACEPKFLLDARNGNVRRFRDGTDVLMPIEALQQSVAEEFQELTDAMNAALKSNDYFRALNSDLKMLREVLAEKLGN